MANIFEQVCDDKGWPREGATVKLPLAGGRSQAVTCESFEEAGENLFRLYSVLGGADILDEQRMRSALSLNYRLRFGALSIREDKLVLTHNFLSRDADAGEVAATVEYLAATADQYEKHLYGTDRN